MTDRRRNEDSLAARVLDVRFSSPDSLWKVLSVETDAGVATVVGEFHEVEEGLEYSFSGRWDVHPRFGEQFRAESYHPTPPTTKRGMIAYLSSGLIRGIGPKMAAKIVDRFGERTFDVIRDSPERLLEVSGIAHTKKEQLVESFEKHRNLQEVVTYLTGLGLTANMAVKLYGEYGDDTIAVIQRDPYRLTQDIFGIGFRRADAIAMAAGIDPRSPSRLRAAIIYVLRRSAESEGHTFLPRNKLLERTAKLLGVGEGRADPERPTPEDIRGALIMCESSGEVIAEEDEAMYLPLYRDAERHVGARLLRIHRAGAVTAPSSEFIAQATARAQARLGLEYGEEQKKAVAGSFASGVMVITGGPGTGKTTIVRGIIEASEFLSGGLRVLLAAPTGRAARRLGEVAGREATTIHRLLGYGFVEGQPVFRHDSENPLEGDVLILDESSMIDIELAARLLDAIPDSMRVIFVGDADQLPSVGPGNFLRDLIRSKALPVVRLTRIYRQDEVSDIVINAHRINNGEMPRFSSGGQSHFVSKEKPEGVCAAVVKLVDDLVNRGPYNLSDLQVLSPMHRGPAGVANLNAEIQDRMNPSSARKPEIKAGATIYRLGDKVMCLKNNYEKGQYGVFNGNQGIVVDVLSPDDVDVDEDTLEVDFDGELIWYGRRELNELTLAYATTVHKSQGSEYPAVIAVVSLSHYIMLQRNLLYTAVTRAQNLLTLVGQQKALGIMIGNDRVRERHSRLAQVLGRGGYE